MGPGGLQHHVGCGGYDFFRVRASEDALGHTPQPVTDVRGDLPDPVLNDRSGSSRGLKLWRGSAVGCRLVNVDYISHNIHYQHYLTKPPDRHGVRLPVLAARNLRGQIEGIGLRGGTIGDLWGTTREDISYDTTIPRTIGPMARPSRHDRDLRLEHAQAGRRSLRLECAHPPKRTLFPLGPRKAFGNLAVHPQGIFGLLGLLIKPSQVRIGLSQHRVILHRRY